MKLLANLAQQPAEAGKPLFTATLRLAEFDELLAGVRDYGDRYLTNIIVEMIDLAESDRHSPREIADLLLGGDEVALRSWSVDQLEEAIEIIVNACQQTLDYIQRARAFAGQRVWTIEPRLEDA